MWLRELSGTSRHIVKSRILLVYEWFRSEDKFMREKQACEEIFGTLGEENSKYFMQLWLEYEAGETYEAKIVKDLDRLEMIQQAWVYEQKENVNLSEFY